MKKCFILIIGLLFETNFCNAMCQLSPKDQRSLAELLDNEEASVCVRACCADFCPVKNQPLCPRMCYALTKWSLISCVTGCGLVVYVTMDEMPNPLCCCAAAAACAAAYGADKADKLVRRLTPEPAREYMGYEGDEEAGDMTRNFEGSRSRYVCKTCSSVLEGAGLDEEVGLRLHSKKNK